MPISGLKSVEIIEEVTFGTTPANGGTAGTWVGVGLVDKYGTPLKKETTSFNYLPAHDDTTGLTKKRTMVTGGTLEATLNYYIQNFDFWKYAMGNASTLGNSLPSFSVSETIEQTDDTKRYIVASGNVVKSIKLSAGVDEVGHVDTSIVRQGVADPTDTDPTGSGTHASEDLSDAILWEDISDMCMDANDPPTAAVGHIIGDLNLEIANNVYLPKDVNETTWTKMAGVILYSHDINVGMHFTLADINDAAVPKMYDLVKNSTLQNLRFTLGDRIAIIKNLLFTEFDPSLAPEEVIGQEFNPETDNADFILAYKMGYAYADDGTVFTDETTEANNTTVNNMNLTPATAAVDDAYYFGRADETFSTLQLNIGTPGEGTYTILWEYYDSIAVAWATCIDIVDGTDSFKAAAGWHDVTHTIQTGAVKNWGKTTINSVEAYWIRAKVSAWTSTTVQPLGTQCWVYGEVSEVAT